MRSGKRDQDGRQERALGGKRTRALAPAADRGHYRAMLSVLESPTFRARVSRLTVAEYHLLGEYNARGKRTPFHYASKN